MWNTGNAADTTATLSGLAAGVYTAWVTDDKGCQDTVTTVVNNIGTPTATITAASIVNPSCYGSTNGAATVTSTGGSGGTMYSWSNTEPTAAATMLPAGQNIVTVTDNAGCSSFAVVNLTQPPAIIVETDNTDVDCNGNANGSVTVSLATGGAGGFSFLWDDANASTSVSVASLSGGTYNVTVTDMNSCTAAAAATVVEPAVLTASTSATNPTACLPATLDGTASATAMGGTTPFTYTWSNICDSVAAGTGSFIFGLDCGYYSVEVVDGNNCVTTIDSVLVGEPCRTDGIEDELSAGISSWSIFPNPTTGNINLEVELANYDVVNLQILDLHGRTLMTRTFDNALNIRTHMDVDLAAGIYLVQLSTSQGTATRKLVVK